MAEAGKKRYLEKLGIPRQNQLHENCSVNSKKSIFCHSSSEGQVTDMVVWPGLCSSALAWFFPGLQTFLNKLFLTKGEWLYFFTLTFAFSTLKNVNVNTGLSSRNYFYSIKLKYIGQLLSRILPTICFYINKMMYTFLLQ